ncbi:hypothetical protein PRIPAC_88326, partial [Pristionchus pacificus]|uniref:Uncharacterized protein n=1 Tax=Pristionchus pacificus TaxID=54126 RepID=A0A2A6B8Q6_PRIPA
ILPSILLFGGGLIFGHLIAFAIVMLKQNQILKKATAPPSPPNKNNSLTKKDSVEVTIEDEVQKQTTQNLNAPMKPSEKRRRAKASTKAINVHMQKRSEKNRYSVSKTKSTGSSSNSIGEESFERRLSNGPKVLPKPGTLRNSATPISKRKHVRTGMHETPEKQGIIQAVFGRCDVADKNKLEMIDQGAVPAVLEFLNPTYSTHTRKTAVEYLLGLRQFATADYSRIKQQKEGKTPYIEIHDFMENNVKTMTAAVNIASEILNESQPKLFASNAEGKLATIDLLSIAIHRLTFSLKLYAKPQSHNNQGGSSKWAFLNSWSGDFADGESAHRNELMDLLKRLWLCAGILARDEKIHGPLLDPNRHLIDNMRLAVKHFQSGAIYVQTPQCGSLCERFIDALCEFSKSGEGLKAVEEMKDVLIVPLATCGSKQGETCANRANELLKKLGTPAKTPSNI